MPDHFATLAQPRRPWLDPAALKDAFHRAAAQQHPDVDGGNGELAASINAAYAILREPAARLRHLLELEWPAALPLSAPIPPALADLFGRIAELRQASAVLARKQTAGQTLITQALLARERASHRGKLQGILAALDAAEAGAVAELRILDAVWDQRDAAAHVRLASVQQHFAFLSRWQAHLREELFQLGA